MIDFQGVSKLYPNDVLALRDITFHVDPGEFVFLVGASGAGKSTLIKLLLRQEMPTRGEVRVMGRVLNRLRPREVSMYRRKIGVVFQDFKLLAQRTVFENVAFALRVIEASPREIRRRVPAALELVGLADKQSRYPHQLSGGEQQRVALARAIVNNPLLLIADEPTGNLDPENSWEMTQLLIEINQRGTTVLMASHAMDIVNALDYRVITLEKGSLVKDVEGRALALEV